MRGGLWDGAGLRPGKQLDRHGRGDHRLGLRRWPHPDGQKRQNPRLQDQGQQKNHGPWGLRAGGERQRAHGRPA